VQEGREPNEKAHCRNDDGLVLKKSRGDWRSIEPLLARYLDAALSPAAETVVATRVMRLSA
jgi:hypothetical protein